MTRCVNPQMGGENTSFIHKSKKRASFRLINVSGYLSVLSVLLYVKRIVLVVNFRRF